MGIGTAPVRAQAPLPDIAFFEAAPISLRTQTATEIAFQRHYGGPGDAGLIASVCSACLLSGSTQGLDALMAQAFGQTGAGLPGLGSLFGGNQFLGPTPPPQTFSPAWEDPFAAGSPFSAGIDQALGVLGFGSGGNSPVNFGTAILQGSGPFAGLAGFQGVAASAPAPGSPLAKPAAFGLPGGEVDALSPVERRYLQLAEAQLDLFYNDDALSALRAESQAQQLGFLHNDPYYSVLGHELDGQLQQIVSTRPSHPAAVALAQEIDSRTMPPDDPGLLEARYGERLRLAALRVQLDAEVRAHLAENPGLAAALAERAAQFTQLVQQISAAPEALAYADDWVRRYQAAFVAAPAFPALAAGMAQLFQDFPAFREYLRLNQEVAGLLPAFGGHPAVQEAGARLSAAQADPELARTTAALYGQFAREVDAIVSATAYKAEAERALERLNGLFQGQPAYALLRDTQFLAVVAEGELRRQIRDAVLRCAASQGVFCDPRADPQVLALLPAFNADSAGLLQAVGQFHEQYNRFLHQFSRSEALRALQAESQARLQAALARALPELRAAQARFEQGVGALPQVAAVRQAMAEMAGTLRRESPELGGRLDRMEQLRRELTGR